MLKLFIAGGMAGLGFFLLGLGIGYWVGQSEQEPVKIKPTTYNPSEQTKIWYLNTKPENSEDTEHE